MTQAIHVYENHYEDHTSWVIADAGGWCAGSYDKETTARYAHKMGGFAMAIMWQEHQAAHPEIPTPVMTHKQVKAWKRANYDTAREYYA